MPSNPLAVLLLYALLAGCAASPAQFTITEARRQVFATERAFAKTMADRDLAAFASFIANDAVFFSGPDPRRGRQQVVDWWARYYTSRAAPFSWEPEEVEALDSGTLALSSGPVRNPQGKVIARFTSIWKRDAAGAWHIVFDKGTEVCNCPSP